MRHSEQIAALFQALAVAQGEIENASKDADAQYGRYADLAAVRQAVQGPLSKHGIACVQGARYVNGMVEIETMLVHGESGQFVSETLHLPVSKQDAHGVGSAITYGRRYGLMAMVGVAPEDDDGNAAIAKPMRDNGRGEKPASEAKRKTPHQANKDGDREAFKALTQKVREALNENEITRVYNDNAHNHDLWPISWAKEFKAECIRCRDLLRAASEPEPVLQAAE